jgi:glycosyltransferase involved in cell wall biosynthesis
MLERKKILFFLPSLEMGGSERQALLLARHLSDVYGAKPVFWAISGKGLLVEECELSGFPCSVLDFQWPSGRLGQVLALAKLITRIRSLRPDFLLPYTLLPSVLCCSIWPLTGAQGCLWNQRDALGYRMSPFWERWALRNTPGFIVNSQHVKDYLQSTFTVPDEKVTIVHNGIQLSPPQLDRDEWRRLLDCGPDDLLVVMVANLHRQKDHATVLNAWAIVQKELAQYDCAAILALAGIKGETFDALTAQAAGSGLSKSIRFTGQVKDVAGLLASAEIGIFCSRSEGSPNGLLECMAAGLPVLATDIPAIREVCGASSDKVLSDPGDAQGFAERLLWLAQEPEQRKLLGEENRQRARTEFSPERMAQQIVAIMEQLILS